ncbi:hypothetical protein [Vibrio agarivorans]|uniref:hypothetical protein n=1 Tax=Vibrio agarivorans TaxID=153622 RepID=UPI0025B2E082|nr:hypothetical protein [Vibrio agarivorans]MDN3661856.1 hypothetical protein [Vibrio agarivorans]
MPVVIRVTRRGRINSQNRKFKLFKPTALGRPAELIAKPGIKSLNRYTPVGKKYPTPEGKLTVVGDNGLTSSKKKLGLVCDRCHQDPDLFQDLFYCTKSNLDNNKVPCACCGQFNWTEAQYILLIKREIELRGPDCHYQFRAFDGGTINSDIMVSFINRNNGEIVKCNDGSVWWCLIDNFLGGQWDPVTAKIRTSEKTRIDDETLTQKFIENGALLPGGRVKRILEKEIEGQDAYFFVEVTCPTCECDEFVQANVGPAIFRSRLSNMSEGKKPCRCSNDYNYSQKEREYMVKKRLKKLEGEWCGWEAYTGNANSSTFNWICRKKHTCNTNLSAFLNMAVSCSKCSELQQASRGFGYGYIPGRELEPDNVYLKLYRQKKTNVLFVKVGRAFDEEFREKCYARDFCAELIDTLWSAQALHRDCYDIEQAIINKFENFRPTLPNIKKSRETFISTISGELVRYAIKQTEKLNRK